MAQCVIEGFQIAGIVATVPPKIARNLDFELISEKDREKLIKTTGIEQRRIVDEKTCTSDLCEYSALELLKGLQWQSNEVEILIFITQTPDYIAPMTSILLQTKLGLSTNCICLDIGLGCSGYVYGLSVITSIMKSMQLTKGLLLVGDTVSKMASPLDKSTYPLFGDAGTATAITAKEAAKPMYFDLKNDGDGFKSIIIPGGGYRNPYVPEFSTVHDFGEGISRNNCNVILEGVDVFNFSIREVPPSVKTVMELAHKADDDISYYIFHQANLMMNELIRKKLGIAAEKVPYSLKEYGNTSSATIPLTIVTQIRQELLDKPENTLVLCGFGVGLSWASGIVSIADAYIPAVLEYEDITHD